MKTKIDGRKARHARTQEALINACRKLMCGGDFRPSMSSVCAQAGCSTRTGFHHFDTLGAMHAAALSDPSVGRTILIRICDGISPLDWPDAQRASVMHAIVFGRPPKEPLDESSNS
jgi:hypothetical protein